jgi:pyruvate ferredoxin oxidoreductase beta subunit
MAARYEEALFTPGHRACPGCAASLAVRTILQASGPDVIIVNATGCVETFTTPYGYSPWGVPSSPTGRKCCAVASGVEAAKERAGDKVKVIVIGATAVR